MRLVHSYSPFEEICFLFGDDQKPVEMSVWRKDDLQTGSLHIARAVRSVGSGWFLDAGNGRSAYMNNPSFHLKPDGTLCHDKLTQGDSLIVRIIRPQTMEKEAEATHKVSLAGQYVVLLPTQKTPMFSRRLDQTSMERLKLLAPNEGVLFRTAACGADLNKVAADIEMLKKQWQELLSGRDWQPSVLYRPIRDVFRYANLYRDELSGIVTDDSETASLLKKEGFSVSFNMQGVWKAEHLDEALDSIGNVRSELPSGGFLMTQQTAACVCFDVNAGSGLISAANEEACPEILRQIRSKGLGGQMIVDFAGRKDEKITRRLIQKLKNENVFISGISTLGLVEMTVEKTRCSFFDLFSAERRSVRVAADIVRRLWFSCITGTVVIQAPADVCGLVRPYVRLMQDRLKTAVKLEPAEIVRMEGIKE